MTLPFYVAPEQLLRDRAEFARKGIGRGRSILGVEYRHGLLLVAENPSTALRKISEVYDRIAFAGVGKYNEFETLRKAGVRQADLMGYLYSRTDVTAQGLATAFSQTLGSVFSHELKPLEVELLIGEIGLDDHPHRMFRVSYDGTLSDERQFCAIGGQAEALVETISPQFQPDLELAQAIELSTTTFREAIDTEPLGWEGGVLDVNLGRRTFRRLTDSELNQ